MVVVMDGVVFLVTVIVVGCLGGVGVLNLEGIWICYVDVDVVFDEIVSLFFEKVTWWM